MIYAYFKFLATNAFLDTQFLKLFYFMCLAALLAHMSVHHMYLLPTETRKGSYRQLWATMWVLSHYVGARSWTRVLEGQQVFSFA